MGAIDFASIDAILQNVISLWTWYKNKRQLEYHFRVDIQLRAIDLA